MATLLRSEEPASRRSRLRRRTLARARGSTNLETDPVRVVEIPTAGVGTLGMCGHTPIVNDHAKLPKTLLRLFYLFYGVDLERQMVQAGPIRSKRLVSLLPQCQNDRVVLGKKRKNASLIIRFTREIKTEDILIKTLRSRQVTDVQSDVSGGELRRNLRRHLVAS